MNFSQRAVEAAAAHILRELDDRGLLKGVDDDLFSEIGNDVAKAALTAALAVDGVALVPKEPTEDMLDFGACYEDPDGLYQNHSIFKDGDISRDVYRAMVEAVSREFLPQPPAASEGEERDSPPKEKP